ncbi:hypothetical protein BGW38_001506, partial [Lunasporangiospora selenospora]
MLFNIKVLSALALVAGTANAALTCFVECTGKKVYQPQNYEELNCEVTRSDGFKSFPGGNAFGDFPSVCNGDYCLTQRWADCRYLDLSVNGKTYSGFGQCDTWTRSKGGDLTYYRRSRVTLGCQF